MNNLDQYMMQNRITLAQIWQMLARNMQLAGSQSLPAVSSTYIMPIGFNAPTMFSQVQGAISDIAGEEVGSLMGFAANPAIRAMLPQVIADPITALMQSAPIGGLNDPAAFMYSQLYRQLGRSVPQITLPFDFQSRFAIDRYNEQQKAFEQFAARYGMEGVEFGQAALEQIPISTPALPMEDLAQVIGFRNIRALRGRDSSFNRAFTLFNEMSIFGPRMTPELEADQNYRALMQAKTQEEAARLLQSNVMTAGTVTPLQKVVQAAMERGRMASGLISGAQMLAGYSGGDIVENTEMQNLGDLLLNVLEVGNNSRSFVLQGAQSLGAMGNIAFSSIAGNDGQPMMAADRITASLADRINARDPNSATNEVNPYTSLQRLGFGRSANLLSELSRGGLLSTGGVDIFGSMTTQDVKQLEDALLEQLEGFSEIANVGRRLGFKTQDIIQNLQGVFGGRLNDAISQASERVMDRFDANGGRLGEELIQAEEMRRAGGVGPTQAMGAEERRDFLRMEARRQGSLELMTEIGETIELGRMIGIDSRGVMAAMSTATQIMQSMGMNGMGAPALTQDAFARVALSRTTGSPITEAESLAMSSELLQRSSQNADFQASAVVIQGIQNGILNPEDAQVQRFLADFRSGVRGDYVNRANELFGRAGVDTSGLFTQTNIRQAMSDPRAIENSMARMATDQRLSLTGNMERGLLNQFGGNQQAVNALMSNIGVNLGMGANRSFSDVLTGLISDGGFEGAKAAVNQMRKDGKLNEVDANRLLAVLTEGRGLAGDGDQRVAAARIIEENQRINTGMTSPEITAEARERVNSQLSTQLQNVLSGRAQDVLTSGLSSVTEDLIAEREQEELLTAAGGSLMFAPNAEALKQAEADLAKADPNFGKVGEKTRQRIISQKAKELALKDPEKYSKKSGLAKNIQEAYTSLRSEAEALIDTQITQQTNAIATAASAEAKELQDRADALIAGATAGSLKGAGLTTDEQQILTNAEMPVKDFTAPVTPEMAQKLAEKYKADAAQIQSEAFRQADSLAADGSFREEMIQAATIQLVRAKANLKQEDIKAFSEALSGNFSLTERSVRGVEQSGLKITDLLKALGGNIGEDAAEAMVKMNTQAAVDIEDFKVANASLLDPQNRTDDARRARGELAVLERQKSISQALVDISSASTPEERQKKTAELITSVLGPEVKVEDAPKPGAAETKSKTEAEVKQVGQANTATLPAGTAVTSTAGSASAAEVASRNTQPPSATVGDAPNVVATGAVVTSPASASPGAQPNPGQVYPTNPTVPVHVSVNLDQQTNQTLTELLNTTKAAHAALTSIDTNLLFKA